MSDQPNIFIKVLKNTWKAYDISARFFLNLAVLIFVIAFLASLPDSKKATVPEGAALLLQPQGEIVEQLDYVDPIDKAMSQLNGNQKPQTLLKDIIDAISEAKNDERIKGIVISTKQMSGTSLTKLQLIGKALTDFKTSGKKVYAIGEQWSQGHYYLAAHADEVILSDQGGVSIEGFGIYRTYMRDFFDKVGINYHIFKVGTYKAAVEPFMRNSMSDPAKEANMAFLHDLWSQYKSDIANLRSFDASFIDQTADNSLEALRKAGGDSAKAALNSQLVDSIKNRIEIKTYFTEIFGENEKGDNFNFIALNQYVETFKPPIEIDNKSTDKIAVIVAKGTIKNGKQKEGSIGGDTLSALIEKARNDDKVKAVVLRVDSPGGSAFASELIRQQLIATQKAGKPVVVSMGSYAASGGYWISANADEIWASPTTITGSIGVFGMIPTIEKPLNDVLGIYRDGVGTNKLTGGLDIMAGIDPSVSQMIQLSVENTYDKFLTIVAEGRNMEKANVDNIAQGRIWSGLKAKELGLVDNIGELDDAIASAAKLAKIEKYDLKYMKRELSPKEIFMKELFEASTWAFGETEPSTEDSLISQISSSVKEQLSLMNLFNDPKNTYAHCFCKVE